MIMGDIIAFFGSGGAILFYEYNIKIKQSIPLAWGGFY